MRTVQREAPFRGPVPIAVWLVAGCYLVLVVLFAWSVTAFAQILAGMGIAAALAHAGFTYGARHAFVLFAICCVITFSMENLGASTGFPFGHYHFEVAPDLPHIGLIPLVVGPLWFGMGYFSWITAAVLLDNADARLGEPFNLFALPATAMLVMTQWDLALDPSGATLAKAWVWHDGGALFGVPATNFFGWLLTAFLFYFGFALYLRANDAALRRAAVCHPSFRALAVLFYLASGLTYLVPWVMDQGGEATDGGGSTWLVHDVRESIAIIVIFTMGFTALLALVRLRRPRL
jgi:putative membrane protein